MDQETARSLSPGRRAWLRFKADKRGYWSLWILGMLFALSLGAELISNDKPLLVRYNGGFYFPLTQTYPEATFGGDFTTPADYLDPFIHQQITRGSNWALYPLNHFRLREERGSGLPRSS